MVVGIGESAIEPALLAGGIRCPDCEARLAPWGHAREREVRMRYGGRLLRPRRGRAAGAATLRTCCCLPPSCRADAIARR